MNTDSSGGLKKALSLLLLIGGAALLIISLVFDFMGSKAGWRGPALVIGLIAFFVGLYVFPTLTHYIFIPPVIYIRRNGHYPVVTGHFLFSHGLDRHSLYAFRGLGELHRHVP